MRILALVACLAAAPSLAQEAVAPEITVSVGEMRRAEASRFMVAAANPLAALAGYDALAAGGSAADAAVAVQAMLNLVEPQSSGIGGGAFALYWDAAAGRLTSFDGRERAPLAADETYWLDAEGAPIPWWDAVIGGRSAGVPGTLKLIETLHARHGRLPWADLLAPAIRTAEEGFAVSPRLAGLIAYAAERGLTLFEPTRSYFFHPDGTPRAAGEILTNRAFAETLRTIAAEGSTAFYEGAIGAALVEAVRTEINPGILTMEDLAAYEVIERAPVCVDYRGAEVCGMGPPSSGGLTVGQILGMLEGFDLPALGPSAEAFHLFAEASKLAYADRGLYMADSDFVDMPEGLLNRAYLAARAELIDPTRAMEKAEPGDPPWDDARLWAPDTQVERPGTSHFSIVDADGNMISMTTTIETGFGSRVMTGGFLLNNELTDFARAPEADGRPIANRVEGGKRPRSSMAPTIVLRDGAPILLTGSPGGSRIIPYVAQSLIAILDWGVDPAEAVAMGHVVNRNGATDLEAGTDAEALAAPLAALGHETAVRDLNSGLHVILIDGDRMIGAADPRREGAALGE
jgi:gamma-glutamyltranspeptidase/glutathione hydrolase